MSTSEAQGVHICCWMILSRLVGAAMRITGGEASSVHRILRFSPRPFIVFAVILFPLTLLSFMSYLRHDRRPDFLEAVLTLPVLYVLILFVICSIRVTVSEQGITIRKWYVLNKFIPFDDIHRSNIQLLAERNWPLMVTIYGSDKSKPLARIGLKAIRQEDANWLCSLPQLKAVTHPGLTKKA
jgi:Ca2+/Na+ antiporter